MWYCPVLGSDYLLRAGRWGPRRGSFVLAGLAANKRHHYGLIRPYVFLTPHFPDLTFMAQRTLAVIQALRDTAQRLATQAPYQWGHMGSCNCGHLAQTITKLTKGEIHARAMQRYGDWERQLTDYCPTSGLPIDQTIDEMLALGFTRADLAHLERLSDPIIRAALPFERRNALRHNHRDDVVLYLRTWADLLETKLLASIELPTFAPALVSQPVPA